MRKLHLIISQFTFAAMLIILNAISLQAQIPQNIDPGQEPDPPSLWENPEYIIPVVVILVFIVGIGLWRRSKRK